MARITAQLEDDTAEVMYDWTKLVQREWCRKHRPGSIYVHGFRSLSEIQQQGWRHVARWHLRQLQEEDPKLLIPYEWYGMFLDRAGRGKS